MITFNFALSQNSLVYKPDDLEGYFWRKIQFTFSFIRIFWRCIVQVPLGIFCGTYMKFNVNDASSGNAPMNEKREYAKRATWISIAKEDSVPKRVPLQSNYPLQTALSNQLTGGPLVLAWDLCWLRFEISLDSFPLFPFSVSFPFSLFWSVISPKFGILVKIPHFALYSTAIFRFISPSSFLMKSLRSEEELPLSLWKGGDWRNKNKNRSKERGEWIDSDSDCKW